MIMELPTNKLKLGYLKKTIPDLSKKDFTELKRSIEKRGILEPIIINQHNKIICGRERYRVALLLGIEKVPVIIRKTNGDSEIKDISLEDNLKRKHLASSTKTKEIKDFWELQQVKGEKGRRVKKRRSKSSRKAISQEDNSEQQFCRCRFSAMLIPELSKLLEEGKINKESASVYAEVSLENQTRIYGILMDDFANGRS